MKTETMIFAVFALLLVPLSWMVVRYFTFLGWAAAVLAAGLVTRRFWWKLAVIVAAAWQLAGLNFRSLDRAPVVPGDYKPIVTWMREHTPTNAVVLAAIADSPVWLACTGRPIILHSKFENHEIRRRYRQFLAAAYGGEEPLHEFCRQYGADYFVWEAGFLSAERRYKAAVGGEPTARPAGDGHFRLETANSRFAVFRVLPETPVMQ